MQPEPRAGEAMRKNSKQFAGGARRGQKTLGWFLTEELLEKTGSPSPPAIPKHDKEEKLQLIQMQQQQQRKRRGGRRARKLTESLSTASEASLPNDADEEAKKVESATSSDFYVYDVASDGYYYEQNGAKGWRRRLPNGVVQPPRPRPPSVEEQQPAAIPRPQVSSLANLVGPALLGQTAYNRYYDANSDGYFFEMASVDGWRKRSVNPPAMQQMMMQPPAAATQSTVYRQHSATTTMPRPHGGYIPDFGLQRPSQSYGAALARGELPAKCVIESSASSSASDDLSYPSLSRPTSLELSSTTSTGMDEPTTRSSRWNDKFIEELIGQFDSSGLEAIAAQTPANSMWARRRCDETDEEYLLVKENLEKIWQTPPTPVFP